METAATGGSGGIMLIAVMAVFLIMMVMSGRGEKKRAQAQKEMQEALKKDDKIVITGGIIGTVTGFKDDAVEIKISENNKLTVLRSGIVKVLTK
ncbi:preprotein translocase subunit YajC [Elusimicrobium posterum]|uniref:preprotein translocase subunit YajC n=1 Tax=Elusimicrobium posterum TaxID=3116653 RepID=UPI003C728663